MVSDRDTVYRIIRETIRQIPRGKVSTYGEIAKFSGFIGRARMVGYALRNTPPGTKLPWHRVVNAQGKISFRKSRHYAMQKQLLVRENVTFRGEKIDMAKHRWRP
jgi:methylated-DNA-protein-cysteine methyltransferase-like protein